MLYTTYVLTVVVMNIWERKNGGGQRRGTWTVEGEENPNFVENEYQNAASDSNSEGNSFHSFKNKKTVKVGSRQQKLQAVDYQETVQETVQPSLLEELKQGVIPFTRDDFKEMGIVDKVMYGSTFPVQVLFKISCPLIDVEDQNKSWNKVLVFSISAVFII